MDRIRLNASEWMDFQVEKEVFLLTNGLGGYCSLDGDGECGEE